LAADLPDLAGALVLGVARGDERCPFHRLAGYPLRAGDLVVFLTGDPDCSRADGPPPPPPEQTRR
jgi:hypothetical protein